MGNAKAGEKILTVGNAEATQSPSRSPDRAHELRKNLQQLRVVQHALLHAGVQEVVVVPDHVVDGLDLSVSHLVGKYISGCPMLVKGAV
jgi:hypothetical protein